MTFKLSYLPRTIASLVTSISFMEPANRSMSMETLMMKISDLQTVIIINDITRNLAYTLVQTTITQVFQTLCLITIGHCPEQGNICRYDHTNTQVQLAPPQQQEQLDPRTFNKIPLKILVIGSTGAGKSSLINLMYIWSERWTMQDYMQGKKNVLIRTKYLNGGGSEADAADSGKSQTQATTAYNFSLSDFNTKTTYDVVVMDTPGLGDVEGVDKDDKNVAEILESVSKTPDLSVIMLVVNGAEPRISSRLRFILTKLQGMVPDLAVKQVIFLLSNVELKPNLDLAQLLNDPNDKYNLNWNVTHDRQFFYNNQLFLLSPQDLQDHNIFETAEKSFEQTKATLSRLLAMAATFPMFNTKQFAELKEGRDKLKKTLVEANDEFAKLQQRRAELTLLAQDVQKGNVTMEDLEKRSHITKDEENFERISTSYHNTVCLTCKSCCHENCGLEEMSSKGDSRFMGCMAFGGQSKCRQCEHEYTSHIHLREKYQKVTKKVAAIDPAIVQALKDAKTENEKKDNSLKAIQKDIQGLEQQIKAKHQDIHKVVQEMKNVCQKFDYVKEVQACIDVLDEQIQAQTGIISAKSTQDGMMRLAALKNAQNQMMKLMKDLTEVGLKK